MRNSNFLSNLTLNQWMPGNTRQRKVMLVVACVLAMGCLLSTIFFIPASSSFQLIVSIFFSLFIGFFLSIGEWCIVLIVDSISNRQRIAYSFLIITVVTIACVTPLLSMTLLLWSSIIEAKFFFDLWRTITIWLFVSISVGVGYKTFLSSEMNHAGFRNQPSKGPIKERSKKRPSQNESRDGLGPTVLQKDPTKIENERLETICTTDGGNRIFVFRPVMNLKEFAQQLQGTKPLQHYCFLQRHSHPLTMVGLLNFGFCQNCLREISGIFHTHFVFQLGYHRLRQNTIFIPIYGSENRLYFLRKLITFAGGLPAAMLYERTLTNFLHPCAATKTKVNCKWFLIGLLFVKNQFYD